MDSRKIVYRQTGIVAIGQAVGIALMLAVYALLGRLDLSVVLGALVGCAIAVGNFFAMALIATVAADRAEAQDVDGGKKLLQTSYPLRLLVLAGLLLACGWSGRFDPIALVLPLVFVRPALTAAEFFSKKGA